MGAEGEIERIKWTVADYHRMAEVELLAPRIDGYGARAPVPEDVLLAIEVAQSSPRFDLRVKVPLYARELAAGDRISISALPTLGIDVAELFNWSGR